MYIQTILLEYEYFEEDDSWIKNRVKLVKKQNHSGIFFFLQHGSNL